MQAMKKKIKAMQVLGNRKFHYYNRNLERQWKEDLGLDGFNVLVETGFLVQSAPLVHLGESESTKYYHLTNSGKTISEILSYGLFEYLKYRIIL